MGEELGYEEDVVFCDPDLDACRTCNGMGEMCEYDSAGEQIAYEMCPDCKGAG